MLKVKKYDESTPDMQPIHKISGTQLSYDIFYVINKHCNIKGH